MSEMNGNGNGSGQNGSANGQIEIEPTGKWQVYWINAEGLKTMPATPLLSFGSAVAFCRGWAAAKRGGLNDMREGLFPVPFKIEAEGKGKGLSDFYVEAIREQADAWNTVFELCRSLGMQVKNGTGIDAVTDFIQGLADSNKPTATVMASIPGPNGSILDTVNNHPSRSHMVGPGLNMQAPPVAPSKQRRIGEFLVGDRVICTDADGYDESKLAKGRSYEVTAVDGDGWVSLDGSDWIYHFDRFRPAPVDIEQVNKELSQNDDF